MEQEKELIELNMLNFIDGALAEAPMLSEAAFAVKLEGNYILLTDGARHLKITVELLD